MRTTLASLLRIGIVLLVLAALVALLLFWPKKQAETKSEGDWTCSMHPQVRQGTPGQCPICGMDLIPVAQLSTQQAGVEVEPVAYRELFKEVRTVGKLDYNESRVAYIPVRVPGSPRVERVYADFTGIQVKKGDHLVDLFAPDLWVHQDAYLRAIASYEKAKGTPNEASERSTVDALRTRLRVVGLLPEQIRDLEKTKQVGEHVTIHSPIGGTVIEKNVRLGQYVKEGDILYRIADLDPIWLFLDIYEFDLGWVRYGQQVEVTLEAYPGETFRGVVTFIEPFLDDKTRTVKVRVNLRNTDHRLKPAMYASALIRVRLRADGTPEPTGLEGKFICPMHPEVVQDKPGRCSICEMALEQVPPARSAAKPPAEKHEHERQGHQPENQAAKPGQVLAIRASAVLDTGRRKVAYRLRDEGQYELVEIQAGPRSEGKDDSGQVISYFPVLKGLKEGDRVVVRGGFLLDSQKQIKGEPSLLFPKGQSPASQGAGGTHKH